MYNTHIALSPAPDSFEAQMSISLITYLELANSLKLRLPMELPPPAGNLPTNAEPPFSSSDECSLIETINTLSNTYMDQGGNFPEYAS